MKKTKLSLIISGVLIISSFVPVLQILILLLNGAIVSLFIPLLKLNDDIAMFWMNALASLVFLAIFYKTQRMGQKILFSLAFILFFLPFLFYSTEHIFRDSEYYFLQFLLTGVVAGGILFLIEMYKARKEYHRY